MSFIRICIPQRGTIDSLVRFEHDKLNEGFDTGDVEVKVYENMDRDHARNQMVVDCLKDGIPYIFMYDSDMICEPGSLRKLYNAMLDERVDMVGGLYVRRGEPYEQIAYNFDVDYNMVPAPFDIEKEEKGYRDVGGTGALLVRTSFFEKLHVPWFRVTYSDVNHTVPIGEDIFFFKHCLGAPQEKKVCYIDSRIRFGHIAKYVLMPETKEKIRLINASRM